MSSSGCAGLRSGCGRKRRRVDDAIAMMGLGEFAGSYPAQLSGGMRQRVCIARTLVAEPRLILLDEPFGALDQQTRLLMGDEVLRLWREIGATVFLITHALDEAAMLADRIARDVGAARHRDRRGRDELAARSRQPDRRAGKLRRDDEPPVEDAARGVDEDDGPDERRLHESRQALPGRRDRRPAAAAGSALPRGRHRQDHDAAAASDRDRFRQADAVRQALSAKSARALPMSCWHSCSPT